MIIGYTELGRPTAPGEYEYNGDLYSVSGKHIDAWKEDESTRFHVTKFSALSKKPRYVLSTEAR
ncbi:hypothetical protein Amn_18920 [Aminobacter sp. Y103A]|nr:hypothetical protein Amn_18920 [Aminobacter sp. SS-2016]